MHSRATIALVNKEEFISFAPASAPDGGVCFLNPEILKPNSNPETRRSMCTLHPNLLHPKAKSRNPNHRGPQPETRNPRPGTPNPNPKLSTRSHPQEAALLNVHRGLFGTTVGSHAPGASLVFFSYIPPTSNKTDFAFFTSWALRGGNASVSGVASGKP